MNDTPDTRANVEGIPPRGDLLESIKTMVEDTQRAQVVGIKDPVSGVTANVVLSPNGVVTPLPASTYDDYIAQPRFRRGTANLTSLTSFIAHVQRFKTGNSVVFGCDDRTKPSLTAVLDYHPANRDGAEGREVAAPDFGRHRSAFAFPLSDEWQAWNKSNADPMSMADFAAFLEDRIVDVIAPGEVKLSDAAETYINRLGGRDRIATPSDLIVLSRGLHVYEKSAVSEARNLSSGEGEISFVSEHVDGAGAPLIVPTTFQLAVPVFRNGDIYALIARLRYRKTPGGLVFWYELWRSDKTFDAAFSDAALRVETETGLPVLLGSPE